MNCPKCGKSMMRTNQWPSVFMPENFPDTVDTLLISKAWVCILNHSDYPDYGYYLLEDKRKFRVNGFGALDWIFDIASKRSLACDSNLEPNRRSENMLEPDPILLSSTTILKP